MSADIFARYSLRIVTHPDCARFVTSPVISTVLQSAADLLIFMLAGGKHTSTKAVSEWRNPLLPTPCHFDRAKRMEKSVPLPPVISTERSEWRNPLLPTPCHFDRAQRVEKSVLFYGYYGFLDFAPSSLRSK